MTDRIFIVDDHPRMRETYALFLSRDPQIEICGMAASGAEALQQIPAAAPDLVIADLSLPDIDGVELVRRLRRQSPSMPILVVSGYHAGDFSERITATGANAYLDKRYAHQQLLPLIRQLLSPDA